MKEAQAIQRAIEMDSHVGGSPQLIKVSKRIAAAMRVGIEQGNAANTAVQIAEDRLKQAKQSLQSIVGTNQGYLMALIEDSGANVQDFANFGLWEQEGETYIRATPPPTAIDA